MPQPTCRHIHANGALCKSPPLRNREYCHFHLDQIGRQLRAARARARHQPAGLKLPVLEDPFAVQVALMQVADAITHDEIDVPRGRLLLSLLRLASRNLTTVRSWKQEPLFASDAGTAITEWPTFEQENQLPQNFDLSTDPETAFPPDNALGRVGIDAGDALPLDAPHGATASRDHALRAQLRQALDDAQTSVPLVTADTVELMDVYEREGEIAARKIADRMVRNDLRRERRMQRLHYEELARNHNIKMAAKKLLQDQQRAQAATTEPQSTDPSAIAPADPGESLRKKPVAAAAPPLHQAGSGMA